MGYTTKPESVRVDFFKPSGKWYCTEAVEWEGYHGDVLDEFDRTLIKHLSGSVPSSGGRLSGMIAVCLSPYNKFSFPLMRNVDDAFKAINTGVTDYE